MNLKPIVKTDIVIIGAGAAGMMAAHFCAQHDKSIYLLDHNNQVGKRILISGGGKCNFTNRLGSYPKDYYSEDKTFVASALKRYQPARFIELMNQHNIAFEERLHGQLFCLNSAKDINKVLLSQLDKNNIKLLLNQTELKVQKDQDGYLVSNSSISLWTPKLVIATGGIVLPQLGASTFGHEVAKMFGHKVTPMVPALVPFKLTGFEELSGNAFIAGISCNNHYVAENVLFTHKGLSGPGILKTSLFWNQGDSIEINWLPQHSVLDLLMKASKNQQLDTILKKHLPNAFVAHFLKRLKIDGKVFIASLGKKNIQLIDTELHRMRIKPEATEGFRKAEVTRGGVSTEHISSENLESLLSPGLFFIGEVLDVAGQLGGHNFQWCWASAFCAGEALK